jgi:hypothetical protein
LAAVGRPAPRLESCLLFRSHHFARRVRNYPANWRELTDTELDALSWSR